MQDYGDKCGLENQPANWSVKMKHQKVEESEYGKVSK